MKNIKRLVVFVVAMMLCAVHASGATTTISKVVVRDCDKLADTSIVVVSGTTLAPSVLPNHWTLDFQLSHAADVVFITDGGTKQEYEATPYCPVGHNTPLGFTSGTHTISVQINGGSATKFTVILAEPAAAAATQSPCVFGSNGEGIAYPSGDPSLHPQLLTACSQYGFKYFRLWATGAFSTAFPSNYWAIPLKWQAAGVHVLAVINFQNSPNYAAPTDAIWLSKINNFPTSAASGVWGICLGNEVDTTTYYTGTVSQLVHLMQLAYPILSAKGYTVIAPSFVKSLDELKQLQSLGALKYCDYVDYHVYESTAAAALAKIDAYKLYCTSVSKQGLVSECGIRGTSSNLANWGLQTQLFFGGLQTRSGIYLQFPLFWLQSSSDPLCQQAALSKTYAVNDPFTTVWKNLSN